YSLNMYGSSVYAGGIFSNIGGFPYPNFALLSSPVTLPVKLIDFTVKKNKEDVFIQWKTADEEKGTLYTVMHSIDGVNFKKLYTVSASGYKAIKSYDFTDRNISSANKHYYRLEIREPEGKVTYSPTRYISLSTDAVIKVIQLPSEDHFNIITTSTSSVLRLFTTTGNMVKQSVLKNGTNTISTGNLAKGVYFYQIKGQDINVYESGQIILQ
ncbi:MAG TPA: T9SS type A sorting domain-containing protein, partial [Flavisolibacter sp.]|nr:T9SS type A sorting domain-containing protein [Flavisolibacter sp.]